MKNLFVLAFCLIFSFPSFANDINANNETSDVKANVITHKIQKDLINMPSCDDKRLVSEVKSFVSDFFEKNKSYNSLARRRKFFILNSLSSFTQENIANYNTSETMYVSSVIAELFMNEGVLKENMRLCKNNDNSNIDDFYILLYPVEDGYKVVLLNLVPKKAFSKDMSFIYK